MRTLLDSTSIDNLQEILTILLADFEEKPWKSRSQKASAAAFKVHPRGQQRPPSAEYEGQLV